MENKKLTKLEKYWIMYDVGNSAFVMLIATIIPIYFNYLAKSAGISEVNYLAYWGYAASVSTVIVAAIGPVLGSIADMQNYKKPLFTISMMVGVIGCAAMSFPTSWVIFLAVFVIAKVGYNASLIFYDSMLVKIIVHGENRQEAIRRMKRALGEVVLEGITTNVDFLYEILENQVFEKGEADTGFLEEQMGIKG